MRAETSPAIVRLVLRGMSDLSYNRKRVAVPITYEIDAKHRLVTSHLTGIVTDEEVHTQRQTIRNDPHFDPSYRQLIDLTGITEVRVTTHMVTAAAADQYFAPGTRRA